MSPHKIVKWDLTVKKNVSWFIFYQCSYSRSVSGMCLTHYYSLIILTCYQCIHRNLLDSSLTCTNRTNALRSTVSSTVLDDPLKPPVVLSGASNKLEQFSPLCCFCVISVEVQQSSICFHSNKQRNEQMEMNIDP